MLDVTKGYFIARHTIRQERMHIRGRVMMMAYARRDDCDTGTGVSSMGYRVGSRTGPRGSGMFIYFLFFLLSSFSFRKCTITYHAHDLFAEHDSCGIYM